MNEALQASDQKGVTLTPWPRANHQGKKGKQTMDNMKEQIRMMATLRQEAEEVNTALTTRS